MCKEKWSLDSYTDKKNNVENYLFIYKCYVFVKMLISIPVGAIAQFWNLWFLKNTAASYSRSLQSKNFVQCIVLQESILDLEERQRFKL